MISHCMEKNKTSGTQECTDAKTSVIFVFVKDSQLYDI